MWEITIIPLHRLPADFDQLESESLAGGYSMLRRLRQGWERGENRFDRSGELLLGAFNGAQLVGVGGVNIDPYVQDAEIGRLRHLYVLAANRRFSVGGRLVRELLAHARRHFRVIRLRTTQASDFYAALGFEKVDEPSATHCLALR